MMSEKEAFWKEIQRIQNNAVNVALTRMSEYEDVEKLLYDVTYDTIYGLMELLDGHKNSAIQGEIRAS